MIDTSHMIRGDCFNEDEMDYNSVIFFLYIFYFLTLVLFFLSLSLIQPNHNDSDLVLQKRLDINDAKMKHQPCLYIRQCKLAG
jgi:hypothetical protein